MTTGVSIASSIHPGAMENSGQILEVWRQIGSNLRGYQHLSKQSRSVHPTLLLDPFIPSPDLCVILDVRLLFLRLRYAMSILSVLLWAPAYSFGPLRLCCLLSTCCVVFVRFGFVPNIMALMSDDESAGCMLLKGLSAAGTLKLIAQPEMVFFCLPHLRGVKRNLLLQTSLVCSDKASKNNKDMQAKKVFLMNLLRLQFNMKVTKKTSHTLFAQIQAVTTCTFFVF
ncbi:unnamed protein product [Miscanthus lutarioriparius]|uniref:Uncharacterized protein n=1 Tax=Miscanthus lutarioriparius TaxID=422564 RepID=A0A811N639_9POAL|nr:unnamed protein product [Miscanthus lutarioriparius]